MSKEYRLPENIKPQDLVRGIINASFWHWNTIDKVQHTEAIEYLNNVQAIDNSNPSEALECLEEIEQKLECCINGGLVLLKDDEIKITIIKQALLKAEKNRKELEEYKKLNLPLLKQILENGIWVKGEHNNFYHLSPTDINIVIKEDYFIIQELYFEDLDCVMDTTGFELCSSDYKGNFWLKEDKTE